MNYNRAIMVTNSPLPRIALLATAFFVSLPYSQNKTFAIEPDVQEWFEREVRPLLSEHCYSCHSSSVDQPKGGLALDSREAILKGGDSGPAAVAGQPDASLLVQAVRRQGLEMPPDKKLTARDQATLDRWVQLGLPWPESSSSAAATSGDWVSARVATHWAWQSMKPALPPQLDHDAWSSTSSDRFIYKELVNNGLTPAPQADSITLLRRLAYDLTGLPPTAEMAAAYSQQMADEATYQRVIDQFINSPQFGVHWGRHWLDVVRYCETLGHEFDYPIRNAWQYRDVVIDGFNTDVPYSDRVREHIAGDLITRPRLHPLTGVNQSLASTGWWWMGDTVHAPVDVRSDWATRVDNQIDVATKGFLGMTVACARCHDHKFDAISLKDYYGFAGVIQSSRRLYCPTDPKGLIADHQKSFDQQGRHLSGRVREIYAAAAKEAADIENWITELSRALAATPDKIDALVPVSSSLFSLRLAVANGQSDLRSNLQSQLHAADQAYRQWEQSSVLFADFSNGLPDGWSVHAAAQPDKQSFCNPQENSGFDWFSSKWPLPARSGLFNSDRWGRRADVVLRSPDFEVQQPCVCIKLRGKGMHSVVLVSNYYMHEFTQLLFDDLRKSVDQPSDAGWITHRGDLQKYFGYPAFLSLEDYDQGWFEVEQVRFAANPPPIQPSAKAIELLSKNLEPSVTVLSELATAVRSAFVHPQPAKEDRQILRDALILSEKLGVTPPIKEMTQLANEADRLRQFDSQAPAATTLITMTEGHPNDARVAIRGNANQPGDAVPRGIFQQQIAGRPANQKSSGRSELAESLASANHPLTARVMVNRVWHHMMGSGLVQSTDNLGVLGGRPTHPELLDYLARQFVQHDWSIKWLVREIALSQAYRTSSMASEELKINDPDGRFWSHRQVKRLTSESLRDSILAVAQSLDLQLGGPSTPVFLTEQMTGRGRPANSGPLDGNSRRSVFVEVRRNFLDPFLLAFDFPMPATSVGKRNVSNVPAQALGLLNDPLVSEMALRWSKATAAVQDSKQRIDVMFLTAFSRPPSDEERQQCLAWITQAGNDATELQQAWNDLAHILFNAKEFSYVR